MTCSTVYIAFFARYSEILIGESAAYLGLLKQKVPLNLAQEQDGLRKDMAIARAKIRAIFEKGSRFAEEYCRN